MKLAVGLLDTATATAIPPAHGAAPPHADPTPAFLGVPQDELTPRVRAAIGALVEEVQRLRHELDEVQAEVVELRRLSDEDPLLPVVNRRAFVRELARAMAAAARYRQPGSVIYLDVNELKRINDAYGHCAGDAVLALIAEILTGNVRRSDVVGRLGGDEFGVVLARADMAVAHAKMQSLAHAIAGSTLRWNGIEIPVSVSAGCYTFHGLEELSETLAAADRAMYMTKRNGG